MIQAADTSLERRVLHVVHCLTVTRLGLGRSAKAAIVIRTQSSVVLLGLGACARKRVAYTHTGARVESHLIHARPLIRATWRLRAQVTHTKNK